MKVNDIAKVVEAIVPLNLAQDWDNVGLLVGDGEKSVKSILLTIDITGDVLAEAKREKTDLIISYHPVIWDGLKNVTARGQGFAVYELIRSGIAVFSVHTALDVARGGVNDGLAEIVGIIDAEPVGDWVDNPAPDSYKLVVFVPVDAAAKVANALFAAGAGRTGNYSHCGFSAGGTGTFLPLQGAKPSIGRKGRLEKVAEQRFETIVPADKLDGCIKAMLKAHPYETPAFDCYKLHKPDSKFGLGRIGKLAKPMKLQEIVKRIKEHTGAKALGIVGSERRTIRSAAVCAGACGKIIDLVIAANVDLYVTGELKHHRALAARQAGVTCICLTHTVSERFILKRFAKDLQKQLKQVKIKISRKDTDPFQWKNI